MKREDKKMQVRILRQDGAIGIRIYEVDVPYDMVELHRKLKKDLIGIGTWVNTNETYLCILPHDETYGTVFFNKRQIKEILSLMEKFEKRR